MWILRKNIDFLNKLPLSVKGETPLPTVRILLGPRQVGKTTLLDRLGGFKLISLDDLSLREQAKENPSLFLDQFTGPIILDEATNSPELFFEIKKRVDEAKRLHLKDKPNKKFDYWITGSNQTLMSKRIQESLAGRAEIFKLNTLSIDETKEESLEKLILRGGWPELCSNNKLSPVSYLNNLIATFIERDIVQAAGIEKRAAFAKCIQLFAGITGEMVNFSELASIVGIESPTVQSWAHILEQNQIIKILPPYLNNLNKRLTKTPKIYFEDVGLATRLQGWTEYQPIYVSPYFGHLVENIAYTEISRFFTNNMIESKIYYLRNKEKIEIDFLIELPNKRFVSAEVKTTAKDYSKEQLKLLESLKLNIVAKIILTPQNSEQNFGDRVVVPFNQLASFLGKLNR